MMILEVQIIISLPDSVRSKTLAKKEAPHKR